MSDRVLGFVFIAATIVLTVYGQLMLKWQVNVLGARPSAFGEIVVFLWKMLTNPWVISGLAAAFGAGLAWMLAVSRLKLSYAYPFMSLTFPAVVLCSLLFFKEPVRAGNAIGVGVIVLGVIIHSLS